MGVGRAPERSTAGDEPPLAVLMYHGVHEDPADPGWFDGRYSVSLRQFAAQLDWLDGEGFRTIRTGTTERSSRDVVLTFDDGDVSWVDVAAPLLRERGMVAEFCTTSDYVGRPGMVRPHHLEELAAEGMGVASHGRTHRFLDVLTDAELTEELTTSRRCLEQWCGMPVETLSIPGGRAGGRELRAARDAGYHHVLNSTPGLNHPSRRPGFLRRITVTRETGLEEFTALVRWRGLAPRRQVLRTAALEVPKRVLGNTAYSKVRAALRA